MLFRFNFFLARNLHRQFSSSSNMTRSNKGVPSKWFFADRQRMSQQFMDNRGFSLPAEITISENEVVVVQWYQEDKHFKDLCSILKPGAEENTKGFQTDEFPTEDDVRKKIKNSKVMVGIDKSSGTLIGSWLFFRSPLARSTEPTHTGGFILVNPNYRGKGLAHKLMIFMAFHALDMGYTGMYGRVAVTARNIVPSRRAGAKYYGIIPNSLKVLGQEEWVDDIVTASDLDALPTYKEKYQNQLLKKSQMTICPMRVNEERREELNKTAKLWKETLQVKGREAPLYVETPNAEQFIQMEHLIRQEAEEGTGFAVDEFTGDGFFNRQLLRKSQEIVITERSGGEPIAAAIFGQSAICRTVSPMGGGYVLVKKEYRRQGIGNALLNFVLEELERQNYKGFLTDVFPHCGGFLHILLSNGFFVTGSIPKVAYVKGQGLTHSLIVYKDFTCLQNQMLPSPIASSKI